MLHPSLMCYSFQDVDPESVLHFILVCPNSFEAAFTADIDVKPVGGDPQVASQCGQWPLYKIILS